MWGTRGGAGGGREQGKVRFSLSKHLQKPSTRQARRWLGKTQPQRETLALAEFTFQQATRDKIRKTYYVFIREAYARTHITLGKYQGEA